MSFSHFVSVVSVVRQLTIFLPKRQNEKFTKNLGNKYDLNSRCKKCGLFTTQDSRWLFLTQHGALLSPNVLHFHPLVGCRWRIARFTAQNVLLYWNQFLLFHFLPLNYPILLMTSYTNFTLMWRIHGFWSRSSIPFLVATVAVPIWYKVLLFWILGMLGIPWIATFHLPQAPFRQQIDVIYQATWILTVILTLMKTFHVSTIYDPWHDVCVF